MLNLTSRKYNSTLPQGGEIDRDDQKAGQQSGSLLGVVAEIAEDGVRPHVLLRLQLSDALLQLLVFCLEVAVLFVKLSQLLLQTGHVFLLLLSREAGGLTVLDHPLLALEVL